MKRSIRTIIFKAMSILSLVVLSLQLSAQKLELVAMAQKTVVSPQFGYEIGFRSNKGLGANIFHQSQKTPLNEKRNTPYSFTGLDVSARIKSCSDLNIYTHLYAGLVNKQFFVVIPEIETRIKLYSVFHMGLGASFRNRQPALSIKIIAHAF